VSDKLYVRTGVSNAVLTRCSVDSLLYLSGMQANAAGLSAPDFSPVATSLAKRRSTEHPTDVPDAAWECEVEWGFSPILKVRISDLRHRRIGYWGWIVRVERPQPSATFILEVDGVDELVPVIVAALRIAWGFWCDAYTEPRKSGG
jgi:hypothetical protein